MDVPYVNIHTHRRTGEGIEVVSVMAGRGVLPEPPFSVGIHPWQPANDADTEITGSGGFDLSAAMREVETAPAAAIGEIGLDLAPCKPDRGEQKMIFAAQLRIAEERRLPVILHCVRAFEPVMEILSGFRLPAVVFHGFVGSAQQASRAVRAGYRLSFDARSLSSPRTVEALRGVPPDRLFLETDDSSTSIAGIYGHAAGILALPVPEIAKQLYENYARLVGTH